MTLVTPGVFAKTSLSQSVLGPRVRRQRRNSASADDAISAKGEMATSVNLRQRRRRSPLEGRSQRRRRQRRRERNVCGWDGRRQLVEMSRRLEESKDKWRRCGVEEEVLFAPDAEFSKRKTVEEGAARQSDNDNWKQW